MSHFINRLVSRNVQTDQLIKPRLKGRFETGEPSFGSQASAEQEIFSETNQHIETPPSQLPKEDQRREQQASLPEVVAPTPPTLQPATKPIEPFLKREIINLPSFKVPEGKDEDPMNDEPIIHPIKQEIIQLDLPKKQNAEQEKPSTSEKQVISSKENIVFPVDPPLPKLQQNEPVKSDQGTLTLLSHPTSFTETKPEKHSPPTIKVTIGRIEVRTQTNSPPPTPIKKRQQAKPNMSLEDYLNKRKNTP